MNVVRTVLMAGLGLGVLSIPARASVVVTQGASAPTYATTLNFDEVGGPTGANVPNNSWAGSPWEIPVFQSGEGSNLVGDLSGATGQGTNAYYGPYGVFIEFDNDLTEMSFQGWDSSGPGGPFGGGAAVIALNDGVDVAFTFVTPAWAGVGDSWYNITTTDGSVFDEVRFLGFGFFPEAVVDNLSWNAVPEPTSLTLVGIGLVALIRRRSR